MKCPRCEGLMVQDQILDPRASMRRIDIWRCLNCGETIDQDVSGDKKGTPPHLKGERKCQVV